MEEQKGKKEQGRERWGSKIGIILAVSGSAIGLGNFLRFPVQAANNGGGVFMIPYFISLLLLGIPLMWMEWTLGRFGGVRGHGTAPGIFDVIAKKKWVKYLGVLGVFGPLVIFIYYTYIESWLLAYSFFAVAGKYSSCTNQESMKSFLAGFQGIAPNEHFQGMGIAYIFFVITFILNMIVVYKGISGGIEKFCNIAVPTLLLCGIILLIRTITLGAPDPAKPDWNFINGLGFLWNPRFEELKNAKIWLAAAGQIFFTLSVGIGVILTYSSYLTKKDDVTASGLSSASANEFAEVILGGTIVIPAAYAFLGPVGTAEVAQSGAFNLGFVTMPFISLKMQFGWFLAFIWFLLLFLAGITSSISLLQPAVSFLEDEFSLTRKKAVWLLGIVLFVLCQFPVFFLAQGVVDELDFWGGTFALVLFGTIETVMFSYVFGIDKAWEEMHEGAIIKIPGFYKFIMKYITPIFLFTILIFWFIQDGLPIILMKNVCKANYHYILFTRIGLIILFVSIAVLVKIAWKNKKRKVL